MQSRARRSRAHTVNLTTDTSAAEASRRRMVRARFRGHTIQSGSFLQVSGFQVAGFLAQFVRVDSLFRRNETGEVEVSGLPFLGHHSGSGILPGLIDEVCMVANRSLTERARQTVTVKLSDAIFVHQLTITNAQRVSTGKGWANECSNYPKHLTCR
ncbi:DNA (cytosine-5-)-methyltransferase [Fusarium flagelliforme]|uniref:DNA (Cytosine-5-)-methyltransferase n=2 Tax=Fusarium flagelliforme TaxID=2675880 RepID=A0A395M499_9HYPO|nr:DNA (cytosine-5-)-methyltransferase [Fusarium flagelliforme]